MPSTYEPIATTSMSGTYIVDFTSIPSSYTDLRLVIVSRSAAGGGTSSGIFVNLNNDYTSLYSVTRLGGDGASAFSNRSSTQTEFNVLPGAAGSGSASNIFSLTTIDLMSYTGSTNKTGLVTCSLDRNGAGTVSRQAFLWRNTSAVNRITLTDASNNNWASGSTATLYGILKA